MPILICQPHLFLFSGEFSLWLTHENSPEKECGGKRIGIKGKITGINCDRRDARAIHTGDIQEEPFLIFPENQILTIPYPVPPEIFL